MKANGKGDSGEAWQWLPEDVARWFIGEVRREIVELQREGDPLHPIESEDVERLVNRFRAEDPRDYLVLEYRFRSGVADGTWLFDDDVFAVALKRFGEELDSGISLDDWLRADIAGTVRGVHGGDDAISNDQWASLCEEAYERRRRGSRQGAKGGRKPRA